MTLPSRPIASILSFKLLRQTWQSFASGLFLFVACPSVFGAAGAPDAAAVVHKPGDTVIESASLTTPAGDVVSYELGTLYVPENRADPRSRVIGVGFARFRALKPTGAPPTFHLPGGPGNSYLEFMESGHPRFAAIVKDIALYRHVGDVVFMDQRGYSKRGEILGTKAKLREQALDHPGSLAQVSAAYVELAHAVVAEYESKGIDLRGYTVKECAADVNELRRAIGYDQIVLIGQSFGSQWSFAVMRLYPQIVARAVLSGVEPLDCAYDMPSLVYAAIQRQWWAAEQDPRLQSWLPPGGLAAAAQEVLLRLTRAPVSVAVKDQQAGTTTIVLGPEDFQEYFLKSQSQPAALLALYYGHYEKWAEEVLAGRRSHAMQDALIGPLIDSSLNVTPAREHRLRGDSGNQFLGSWDFDWYLATAEIWPTPDVGDDFRTEIVNRIPVLFVQGDWDTSTPMENLLQVAPFFINSRMIIVSHGGHSAYSRVRAELPEATASVMEFLRTGGTVNLPARVILKVPKFDVPDFPVPTAKTVR